MNKKHIQAAIDALKKVADDEFIADIVRELEAHHETLTDENTEDKAGDGGNHPKDPPPIP